MGRGDQDGGSGIEGEDDECDSGRAEGGRERGYAD